MTVFYQKPSWLVDSSGWIPLLLPCKPETLLKHLNKSVDKAKHCWQRTGKIGTIEVEAVWFIRLGKIWVSSSANWLEMSKQEEREMFIQTVATMTFPL